MSYHYELKRNGGGAFTLGNAGETLSSRDLVYLNASGEWVKADPSSWDSVPVVGLALANISNGKRGRVFLNGFVGDGSWAWTPGETLYCAADGTITSTAPAFARQTVGHAVSSNLILFERAPVENIIYWSNGNSI